MKLKLTLTILLTAIFILAYSQNISVKSFRMLETDLDARVNYPKTDQNGEKCAIIKVVTTEQGFVWEGDALGITETKSKTSEYWLYIPRGAKRLTIKHAKLGMLRDYVYPLPIKEAMVYEMVLTTAKVTTIVEQTEIPTQWLVINSEPEGADVFINDQHSGNTPFTKKMEVGKYNYRLELGLYHTDAGTFELTEAARKDLKITLKPNFGYAKINTSPEQGASVDIDGVPTNSNTPFTSQKLISGKHKVTVKKVMFSPKTQEFTITDGQTTSLNIVMEPNFATVNITTTPEAEIYIDDERKGNGTYTGRVLPGLHTFEAKKDKHYSDKKQQEFAAGENVTISLYPRAKTGKADIISTPIDAAIKLNGVSYGTTPTTLKDLLIGNYTLILEKQGFGTITKTITITENQTLTVNETLPAGLPVTIASTPAGAQLNIDGTNYGTTPQTLTLSFGSHSLKLVNGKKEVAENINVSQNGKTRWEFNVGEFSGLTEMVKGVTFEMVAVQGGTFQMGSYNGDDDEKPVHSVTLSDFYIGKYEVTQAQWRAVMGNNPSNFSGCDNCPVEKVSWYDIQDFLKKLNQLTGKNYRLPTEAEWEYAARGGNQSKGYTYSGSNDEGSVAWYSNNSGSKTHPVGGKQPNELGIYDMSGNVWEWCNDWYGSYSSSSQTNPKGLSSGSSRVGRGGSWNFDASYCRVANRDTFIPVFSYDLLGFRLVFVP